MRGWGWGLGGHRQHQPPAAGVLGVCRGRLELDTHKAVLVRLPFAPTSVVMSGDVHELVGKSYWGMNMTIVPVHAQSSPRDAQMRLVLQHVPGGAFDVGSWAKRGWGVGEIRAGSWMGTREEGPLPRELGYRGWVERHTGAQGKTARVKSLLRVLEQG